MDKNKSSYSNFDILQIAKYQKILLWCICAGIILLLPINLPATLGLVVWAGLVLVEFWCVYKITRALDFKMYIAILFVISMLIPILSFWVLLILIMRATKAIKSAGFEVSLFGANLDSIKSKFKENIE